MLTVQPENTEADRLSLFQLWMEEHGLDGASPQRRKHLWDVFVAEGKLRDEDLETQWALPPATR